MKSFLFSMLFIGAGASVGSAADFEKPVRLKAGGAVIAVEEPGFAAPSWADIDGDGKPSLLVGQFNKGKIQVFKHLGGQTFAPSKWLQAGGKDAEIPGVW